MRISEREGMDAVIHILPPLTLSIDTFSHKIYSTALLLLSRNAMIPLFSVPRAEKSPSAESRKNWPVSVK